MGKQHPDFPTRAATVFRDGVGKIELGGVSVELQPFTLQRVALLHSVESPMFYPDSRLGVGVGWEVSVFIMATDGDEADAEIAHNGVAGLVLAALKWCRAMQDFELVAQCAIAIRDAWKRIEELDPPDILGEKKPEGEAGNG